MSVAVSKLNFHTAFCKQIPRLILVLALFLHGRFRNICGASPSSQSTWTVVVVETLVREVLSAFLAEDLHLSDL